MRMAEAKNNNLAMFRKEVQHFLTNSEELSQDHSNPQILSYDQLKDLVNHLCNEKLLHPSEVKKILTKIQAANQTELQRPQKMTMSNSQMQKSQMLSNPQISQQNSKKKIVSFPLSVKEFQNILMVQFGDENCQNLLTDLKKFKTLLKQIKGVLNVWKDKGLTNEEKAELESIFARGNEKIANLCSDLKKKKQLLENISEQEIQMIKALDEFVVMQKVTRKYQNFQDFQKSNKSTINSLFNKLQVKEVHFKKSHTNMKNQPDIFKVKAYNSKNDEPVDVVLILKQFYFHSRNSINFEKINKELIKFDALKELSLSEHFPKFLGFNTHSSPVNIQYFVESIQSRNLSILIKSQKGLNIQSPLVKYWMYQIYKAFYDLFLMCSYEPELPIKLEHFEVKDYGLQIVLKNVNFVQKRKRNFATKIDPLETRLLQNLGTVLLSLLNINPQFGEIDKCLTKLQEKCFFKGLLNAIQSHSNYEKSIADNNLSFFNLQTHILLEESQFSQGIEIIENYMAVFGNE